MQADIFKDLCTSAWEHQAENFPTHTRELGKFFNPISYRDVPDAGAFLIIFNDGSVAMCGARGSSIISTFYVPDHADPYGFEATMAQRLERLIEESPPIDAEDFLDACKAVEPDCNLKREDKGFTVHFPDGSTYTDDGEGRSAIA